MGLHHISLFDHRDHHRLAMTRNNKRLIVGGIIVAAVVGGTLIFRKGPPPPKVLPTIESVPTKDTSLYFDGIPPEGIGGDPLLNLQKNRTALPEKFEQYSIPQIIAIPSQRLEEMGEKQRRNWSDEANKYAAKWENKGVMVEGYLIDAKRMGRESANGQSDVHRDMHLWLVFEKHHPKSESIVVEITPRVAANHPNWIPKNISKLARNKHKVRITGWLLWDSEHTEEVGKSRATLWEIHPITKIEILKNGTWEEY
jgi:hypothetical protein